MKIFYTIIFVLSFFTAQSQLIGYDAVIEGKQYSLIDVQTEFLNICVPEHVFLNIIDQDSIKDTWCIHAVYQKNTAWDMIWDEKLINLTSDQILELRNQYEFYYSGWYIPPVIYQNRD